MKFHIAYVEFKGSNVQVFKRKAVSEPLGHLDGSLNIEHCTSIRSDPTHGRYVDDLLVRAHAFDFVIGLRARWIAWLHFGLVRQGSSVQAFDCCQGGIDIIDLKSHVIDPESSWSTVRTAFVLEDRNVQMTVG